MPTTCPGAMPLPDAQPDMMQLHAIPLSSVVAHQKEDVLK